MTGVDARPLLRLVADERPSRGWTLLDGPVRFPRAGLGEPGPAERLDEHLARHGARAPRGNADLVDRLAAGGLTGRGGAHFPAGRKWQAVRDATRRTGVLPVVVANAAEGEPASAKDAALLSRVPHLVLDGLADAAQAVAATESVVWLHGDSPALHRALGQALLERRAAGLVEPPVRLATGPSGYLSGESSAVVRALSGGPALPEHRREPAAVHGVNGRPTLVQNVETLARVALLARGGGAPVRQGSLLTVLAGGRRTVVEVDAATTVREAALRGGWPADAVPQAVLLGGYGGVWLPWSRAADLVLDEPALRAAGVSIGAGVVALLPAGACGVAETARVADYLARSSARQCGPCLFGLPAVAGVLTALRHGTARRGDLRRLQRWAAEIAGRGACHHPDGTVRMALSALTTFAADVEAHRRRRPCAGAETSSVLPVPGAS